MANEDMRETWTAGASGWVENEALFDAVFAPVTAAIIDAASWTSGQRLLDIGCGSGTLLRAAVAERLDAVGVDISEGMAAAARRRVPQATVLVEDAQEADLLALAPGAPFDRVVSRFGVMFFADPVAAFSNIRRATAPQSRLTFACWRTEEENPMFSLGTSVLIDRLEPQPEPEDGAPGPMAFADRTHLLSVLEAAGWSDADAAPLDFTCDYGINGSDGVEERVAGILGTATGRRARAQLEPALGADGWRDLLAEMRAELRRHLVDGVVRFPGAVWLVTARS